MIAGRDGAHPAIMNTVPFIGRLDVTLACLLVVERHGSLADRSTTFGDIWRDVLAVVDHLDLPAACLEDLDHFEDAVEDSLERLVDAGWVGGETVEGIERFGAIDMSSSALDWIRNRLARDPLPLRAFEDLHSELTSRVLEDYGEEGVTASFSATDEI